MDPTDPDTQAKVFTLFDSLDQPFLSASDVSDEFAIDDGAAREILEYMDVNGMFRSSVVSDDAEIYWPTNMPNLDTETRAHLIAPGLDDPLSVEDLSYLVSERD